MEIERALLVALEDQGTAPAVARKAALVAMAERARVLVLLHVKDALVVTEVGFAMSGCWVPGAAPVDEAGAILDAAERTLSAVYGAHWRPVPAVERVIAAGSIPQAIARAAETYQAVGVVLGARRPHRLGLLFHPDVAARIAPQLRCPLHVAPLLR